MPKKRFTSEDIIHKLREAEVMSAQGKTVSEISRQLGVTEQTYFRWRKEYGGLKIDQATRRCLALHVARQIRSNDVIDIQAEAMVTYGVPAYLRSDNGPEMVAKNLRRWLASVGSKTLYIEPGSPWENGYCESFNGKFGDELLNGEIFYTLREAQVIIERWRHQYNTVRPHSSLKYRPPAPQATLPASTPAPLRLAA
ncbi:transposase [Herbaspirillum rubrisubalbicans M1]|nr:integrase core domain-containing protein [Herbaspirillum rubrisubalbicans]ALU89430.1 transposase [Herbaspirillum rubrisubalbicans M1]